VFWQRLAWCSLLLFLSVAAAWPKPKGPLTSPALPGPGELRGLWVDAYGPGFKTPEEVERLLADARSLNLNALFVQAVRRGDCYCNRASVPRTEDPAVPPGFDPLAYLIPRAHAAGIQVHAWVITTALWGADDPPSDPTHAYNRHGPSAVGEENWLNVRVDGVTRADKDVYLDPGHPAVAGYLAALVRSLAEGYDLDGISFDRLRYPDYNLGGVPSWGYNPVSLARFAAETGGDAYPEPTDPAWTRWRRAQVSALMRRLFFEVKATDPSLWVSAATIAYGAPPDSLAAYRDSHAYKVVLQDWMGWLAAGFLDLNLPMNYKQAASAEEAAWFGAWNRVAALLGAPNFTAVATAIYLNDQEGTVRQLEETLAQEGISGWVGYSYRLPDVGVETGTVAHDEAIRALAAELTAPEGPFAAPRPFGPPPTAQFSAISGWAEPGVTVELLSAEGVLSTKADGNGFYGFVVPPRGDYRVRLQGGPALPVSLSLGEVTQVPTLSRTWHAADEGEEVRD